MLIILGSLISIKIVAVSGAAPFSLGVNIESPINGVTYQTNNLLLNITSDGLIATNIQRSCTYTLDGKNGGSIDLRIDLPTHFSIHAITIGETMLHNLTDGKHVVTVTLTTIAYAQPSSSSIDTASVTFFVDTGPKIDISPLSVAVCNPKNMTYNSANVTLDFTVNKQTSWMCYSLDWNSFVPVAGNTTLTGLSNGQHTLAVLASEPSGHTDASETIYFTIAQEAQPETEQSAPETQLSEPFLTTLILITAAVAVASMSILFYFRKRKRTQANELQVPQK